MVERPTWLVKGRRVIYTGECDVEKGVVFHHTLPQYRNWWPNQPEVESKVYTVRDAFYDAPNDHWAVRLEEVRNPLMLFQEGIDEGAFPAVMFRPVWD